MANAVPIPVLIQDLQGLEQVVCNLSPFRECALDTEADSMHHYNVRLCLIQIKAGQFQFIIDPLTSLDLQPLWKIPALQHLILHGADYDLRMIYNTYGVLPQSVFDTMVASRFLGEERVGLANLVEKFFGRSLSKANQKADWTLRPLPETMLQYAALDTEYLFPLRDLLEERLRSEGKLDWIHATCDHLIASVLAPPKHDADKIGHERWRIKGSNKLFPRELQVLRALHQWREIEAANMDRPPFKVVGPNLLLDLSRAFAALGHMAMPRLPRNFSGERLERFQTAVDQALSAPSSQWPPRKVRPINNAPSPDSALLEKLRTARDQAAARHHMDPTLLANRNQLLIMAQPPLDQWEKSVQRAGLLPWQWKLISGEL